MKTPRARIRRGLTLVEMMMTGFLMAIVAALLGNAWTAFGRPAIAAVARSRVAQEANLAAEALARDVGMLVQDGGASDSRYLLTDQTDYAPVTLALRIDDGSAGGPRTVTYALSENNLVRTDGDSTQVVATLLQDFEVTTPLLTTTDGAGYACVQIDMTFTYRTFDRNPIDGTFLGDYTRRYTLIIPPPQPAS